MVPCLVPSVLFCFRLHRFSLPPFPLLPFLPPFSFSLLEPAGNKTCSLKRKSTLPTVSGKKLPMILIELITRNRDLQRTLRTTVAQAAGNKDSNLPSGQFQRQHSFPMRLFFMEPDADGTIVPVPGRSTLSDMHQP